MKKRKRQAKRLLQIKMKLEVYGGLFCIWRKRMLMN